MMSSWVKLATSPFISSSSSLLRAPTWKSGQLANDVVWGMTGDSGHRPQSAQLWAMTSNARGRLSPRPS